MSNFLALATVTTALRQVVQDAAALAVPGATVTTARPAPADAGMPEKGVNLYLFQVTPNAALRNSDLPARRGDGSLAHRPQIALDLHYLLSFFGSETDLEPQRLLGSVASALHARPVFGREAVRSMIDALVVSEPGHYLTSANLDEQAEVVRLTQVPLNLEEQSKLWSGFFQTPYTLSLVYLASVVLIESGLTPQAALPVQQRNIYAVNFREPIIDRITAEAGASLPITAGSTVRIAGRALAGDAVRVRIGDAELTPAAVRDSEILLPLTVPPFPADTLRAGVHGVQVVQLASMGTPPEARPAGSSNVAALVLRPTVTAVNAANVTGAGDALRAADIGLTLSPTVGADQRVVLLLNEQTAASPAAATVIAPRRDADAAAITVPVQGVRAGTYWVRVQVDGAESPLDLNPASPTFGPLVTIP